MESNSNTPVARSGTNYEKLVEKFVTSIREHGTNVQCCGSGRPNRIEGASGYRHQIDVSFEDHNYQPPRLILIECKNHGRVVTVAAAKIMRATVEDIAAHTPDKYSKVLAFIATTRGYQSGAKQYAQKYNINIQIVPFESFRMFEYDGIGHMHLELTDTFGAI